MLVRLLGEAGVSEDVPGALCQLVADSAELQQAAADADAIAKLALILGCVQGGLYRGGWGEEAAPTVVLAGVVSCGWLPRQAC